MPTYLLLRDIPWGMVWIVRDGKEQAGPLDEKDWSDDGGRTVNDTWPHNVYDWGPGSPDPTKMRVIGEHPRRAGRPPKVESEAVLTERLELKLSPEMKSWVRSHGGAEYIRRLVEEDRSKVESDSG